MYDFSVLKSKIKETEDWLVKEFSMIRTGRASTAILDSIKIDSYGSKVPINQIGSITTEDARTIRIVPWDQTHIQLTEQAISSSDLGVSVSSDEKGVRVIFPALTEETRENILKSAKAKLEEAKVSLRRSRDEAWSDIQKKEKDGDIAEDVKFTVKEEMEKLIKETITTLDEKYANKEKEILS